MKLHADTRNLPHAITAYGRDSISVGGRAFCRSLLLTADRIDEHWGPARFADLEAHHLAPLATLPCDVLLLGTGTRQRFPPAPLLRALYEAGRGIEIMDTAAACRTYNILLAEGRAVAAALILDAEAPPAN